MARCETLLLLLWNLLCQSGAISSVSPSKPCVANLNCKVAVQIPSTKTQYRKQLPLISVFYVGYASNVHFEAYWELDCLAHPLLYMMSQRGDYVDIKCNPSIHKGMPFKHYHGRTGVVFNVTKTSLGLLVNKQASFGRLLLLKPSDCLSKLRAVMRF